MVYVFLDANIYIACALVTSEVRTDDLLLRFSERLARGDLRLLVPDVVLAEYKRRVVEHKSELAVQLRELKRAVSDKGLGSKRDAEALDGAVDKITRNREEAFERATRVLEKVWGSEHCRLLSLTPEILVRSYLAALQGVKPASGQRPLDADSVIAEELAEELKNAPVGSRLHFCSNDKDFLSGSGDHAALHPDVCRRLVIPTSYYKGMPSLLSALNLQISRDTEEAYGLAEDYRRGAQTAATAFADVLRQYSEIGGTLTAFSQKMAETWSMANSALRSIAMAESGAIGLARRLSIDTHRVRPEVDSAASDGASSEETVDEAPRVPGADHR